METLPPTSAGTPPLVLRSLPLATRLTLAAFLVSIGVGYCSALVQLHFQHASPGKLLPDAEDAVSIYHGRSGMSQLERLLAADEGKPFNGSGTMRQTFTSKSGGWKSAIQRLAKEKNISLVQAEQELRVEREGERLAFLDWIRTGARQETFEENNHVLPAYLASRPITADFVEAGPDGTTRVKVASIMETRCGRCHSESVSGRAAQFPLESWDQVREYCEVETAETGVSVSKLAQSTHIHLFGFALIYGLTGLVVSFTSYPFWMKAPLAVLPLTAGVVDISFWWLARMDPLFARAIIVTGGLVAASLAFQIVLSLFNMFGRPGKLVLVVLLVAAAAGGFVVKNKVIDPYLAKERVGAASSF